jgi:hypothetical protein
MPGAPVPTDTSRFEFVRLASLRTAQLMRGCTARVPAARKLTTTAQREVSGGMVCGLPRASETSSGT